jgi:hypothetical protein
MADPSDVAEPNLGEVDNAINNNATYENVNNNAACKSRPGGQSHGQANHVKKYNY